MSEQLRLRRRIAILEAHQVKRLAMIERRKKDLDDIAERKSREIENLKAQTTIGVAR